LQHPIFKEKEFFVLHSNLIGQLILTTGCPVNKCRIECLD
jgi:hypothetical protein